VELITLDKTINSYEVKGLTEDTLYNFEVIAKYSDGGLSDSAFISVLTDVLPSDVTPPANISNLNFTSVSTIVSFSFVLPSDEDFSHIIIYRDGNIIEPR